MARGSRKAIVTLVPMTRDDRNIKDAAVPCPAGPFIVFDDGRLRRTRQQSMRWACSRLGYSPGYKGDRGQSDVRILLQLGSRLIGFSGSRVDDTQADVTRHNVAQPSCTERYPRLMNTLALFKEKNPPRLLLGNFADRGNYIKRKEGYIHQ